LLISKHQTSRKRAVPSKRQGVSSTKRAVAPKRKANPS